MLAGVGLHADAFDEHMQVVADRVFGDALQRARDLLQVVRAHVVIFL
jgi:hypothetical protein